MTGAELREIRETLGLSVREFAAALGLAEGSARNVRRYELAAEVPPPIAAKAATLLRQVGNSSAAPGR